MDKKRDQEDEELMKHVCKLCNKRYPSGKSLGGHMRSHVIASRNNHINNHHNNIINHNNKPISIVSSIPKKSANLNYVSDENDDDENGGKISGYGLRENPKKTWRLVDSTLLHNSNYKQLHFQQTQERERERERERVCRQCGKGFNSLKALCGHMSSHSEKEKGCFKDDEEDDEEDEEDDNSWSSDSKNHHLISTMESENSDNNNNNRLLSSTKRRTTRSCLSRYSSLTPSPPTNGGASSSNHSEIDQHEQEEVAMSLMMLSKDSSGFNNNNNNINKGCLHFSAESSDNNSVILEGGSSTDHVGILRIKGDNKMIKQVVVVAAKEEDEINVIGNDDDDNNNHHEISMDNSDSGYFENGAKELESDDSVDGFVRNYDGFKKPKVEFGSCFYDDDDDSGKRGRIRGGLVGNYSRFDSNNPELDENSSKKMKIKKKMMIKEDYYGCMKKGSKYECWVCYKTFKTHQALGGHVISHRKNGDNSLIDTSITNNKQNLVGVSSGKIMGSATTSSKSKKVKGHKCPYCTRVFKSGQALGGHKRSHMMGAGRGVVKMEEKPRLERPVLPPPMLEPEQHQHQHQHQHQQQGPMIDLNLPAPMEEEGNSQFVAW